MPELPLVIVAVDEDAAPGAVGQDLAGSLVQTLGHRFDRDYEVVGVSPAALLRFLDDRRPDRAVAAVVAGSSDGSGAAAAVRLLAQVRGRSAGTQRILLVQRGGWRNHPVREAMVLGQVDGYLFVPWAQPEQWLYLPMSEYLSAWHKSQPPMRTAFTLVGQGSDRRSFALRDILSRVEIPYRFLDSDSPAGRAALADLGQDGSVLPVLVYYDGRVLLDPSDLDLIELIGFPRAATRTSYDVAIIGAGPSGMSAAVYAASEGLRTVIIDPNVPGGQAGTSSMIRNYLGFPHGVSGSELTNRAVEQAWLFGTEFLLAQQVTGLEVEGERRRLTLSSGSSVLARSVIVATGVSWRRLEVAPLESLLGAGVFYGAAASVAPALHGEDVVVVGGGNSAGQAAVHLARYVRSVTIVVRREGLAATMSDYLVQEIAHTANISVRTKTQVVDGGGGSALSWVTLEGADGREELPARALFVMIGAEPRTEWLAHLVQRDASGYLLTGSEVRGDGWPLDRPPFYLETSVPGVFAVGDVASGSTKRVAPSVGAGAVAVELVHRYLA